MDTLRQSIRNSFPKEFQEWSDYFFVGVYEDDEDQVNSLIQMIREIISSNPFWGIGEDQFVLDHKKYLPDTITLCEIGLELNYGDNENAKFHQLMDETFSLLQKFSEAFLAFEKSRKIYNYIEDWEECSSVTLRQIICVKELSKNISGNKTKTYEKSLDDLAEMASGYRQLRDRDQFLNNCSNALESMLSEDLQDKELNPFAKSSNAEHTEKLSAPLFYDESSIPLRYSEEVLLYFKKLLEKKLKTAIKELKYLQDLISDKNYMDGDEGGSRYMTLEDGSFSTEREQIIQIASRQIIFIEHLEKALIRIENKTYGVCVITGKLIDKKRLKNVPHATLSAEAKMNI